MKQLNEDNFTELFKFNPESAFRRFFDRYYFPLCAYAIQIVDDFAESEDIVQSFFVDFWEKQRYKYITGSFYSYALKSVYHQALKARNHPTENLETFLLDHIGPVVEEDMDEKGSSSKRKGTVSGTREIIPQGTSGFGNRFSGRKELSCSSRRTRYQHKYLKDLPDPCPEKVASDQLSSHIHTLICEFM